MKKAVIVLYVIVTVQAIATVSAFGIAYGIMNQSFHDSAFTITRQIKEYSDSHYVHQ